MHVPKTFWAAIKELGPVALVAVGVVLASTVVTSVFDKAHPVDAEADNVREVRAERVASDQQRLVIQEWGVALTVPLAPEMPLLSYAAHSGEVAGLTTEGLRELNKTCTAGRNSLGALVRLPAGSFAANYGQSTLDEQFIKTLGGHDYVYQWFENSCIDSETAAEAVMRQKTVLYEALSSLAATP